MYLLMTRNFINELNEKEFDDSKDNWQILPSIFERHDEMRGPFTHNVCATNENKITKNYLPGDFRDHSLHGHAFVIHPPFGAMNQKLMYDLLMQMDKDFDVSPHDTKFLLYTEYNPQAAWWKLLCRYELLEVIEVHPGSVKGTSQI